MVCLDKFWLNHRQLYAHTKCSLTMNSVMVHCVKNILVWQNISQAIISFSKILLKRRKRMYTAYLSHEVGVYYCILKWPDSNFVYFETTEQVIEWVLWLLLSPASTWFNWLCCLTWQQALSPCQCWTLESKHAEWFWNTLATTLNGLGGGHTWLTWKENQFTFTVWATAYKTWSGGLCHF